MIYGMKIIGCSLRNEKCPGSRFFPMCQYLTVKFHGGDILGSILVFQIVPLTYLRDKLITQCLNKTSDDQ